MRFGFLNLPKLEEDALLIWPPPLIKREGRKVERNEMGELGRP